MLYFTYRKLDSELSSCDTSNMQITFMTDNLIIKTQSHFIPNTNAWSKREWIKIVKLLGTFSWKNAAVLLECVQLRGGAFQHLINKCLQSCIGWFSNSLFIWCSCFDSRFKRAFLSSSHSYTPIDISWIIVGSIVHWFHSPSNILNALDALPLQR